VSALPVLGLLGFQPRATYGAQHVTQPKNDVRQHSR